MFFHVCFSRFEKYVLLRTYLTKILHFTNPFKFTFLIKAKSDQNENEYGNSF